MWIELASEAWVLSDLMLRPSIDGKCGAPRDTLGRTPLIRSCISRATCLCGKGLLPLRVLISAQDNSQNRCRREASRTIFLVCTYAQPISRTLVCRTWFYSGVQKAAASPPLDCLPPLRPTRCQYTRTQNHPGKSRLNCDRPWPQAGRR